MLWTMEGSCRLDGPSECPVGWFYHKQEKGFRMSCNDYRLLCSGLFTSSTCIVLFPNTPIVHCIYQDIYVTHSDKTKTVKPLNEKRWKDKSTFLSLLFMSIKILLQFGYKDEKNEFRMCLFKWICVHTHVTVHICLSTWDWHHFY